MAGGYTHITLAQLAIEEAVKHSRLHNDAQQAVQKWKKFVVIGAMGPDYPYLDIADTCSEAWASAMHEQRALDLVRELVRQVRAIQDENVRQKCMAWLFGFAGHCVTDGVIHPVVNLKVGPYEYNKTAHRRCELSHDVFVHPKLGLGPIELNQQLSYNVKQTVDQHAPDLLDQDLAQLWAASLKKVYADRLRQQDKPSALAFLWSFFSVKKPATDGLLAAPDPSEWHRAMKRNMQLAERAGVLIPFARHAAVNAGLTYPVEPDLQYINGLDVPNGKMDFEAIFNKALGHIVAFWQTMSLALQGRPSPLDSMAGWSLDQGLDSNGNYVFWSV